MKRILLALVLIMVFGLPATSRQRVPAIEFDSITKEIGKLAYDGEVIMETFKFTNKGDATLEILGVQPSCGCTSAIPSPSRLAPGESGRIDIKITTAAITAGTMQKTEFAKTITVLSNDPKHPSLILTINGNVAPEVSLSQPNIWFGNNPPGQEVTKELIAEISPDRSLKIVGISSSDANVTVKLEPIADGNGKKFRIIAVQKPITMPGMHAGEIILKTTSALNPLVRFTVRGMIVKK
jgi:hypothetical protein